MPIYPPYVIERTSRGERSYDIFSRLLMDRIVFLGTGIDDNVANIILAQLLFLDAEDRVGLLLGKPRADRSRVRLVGIDNAAGERVGVAERIARATLDQQHFRAGVGIADDDDRCRRARYCGC